VFRRGKPIKASSELRAQSKNDFFTLYAALAGVGLGQAGVAIVGGERSGDGDEHGAFYDGGIAPLKNSPTATLNSQPITIKLKIMLKKLLNLAA